MLKRSQESPSAASDYHPWTTYIDAREEARSRGDRKVGTECLLVALLREPTVASVLGVDAAAARAALAVIDDDALAAVGVDLNLAVPPLPVRAGDRRPQRPTIKDVWVGRLPLTPAAKTVLQESSQEMRGFGGHHLGPQHVLATLLELRRPDPAVELLACLGVDASLVRQHLAVPDESLLS